ncbi:MAG: HAD-IA family hydrolase, partial [Phycisphaerae bacterium]|nr:HAD-IA family hydrolase [Phycisphaerae bacterium]
FASHLTAARKPDPLAFENVEQCLRVPAECILFFDDREENIAGAVWQHWQTQLINPDQDPVHQLDKYLKRHNVL